MIEYVIKKDNWRYYVFSRENLIFSVVRKGGFWSDQVYFYNVEDELVCYAKPINFLMLFLGHKVTFPKKSLVCKLKKSRSSKIMIYDNNVYQFKYGFLQQRSELFLNGEVGGTYDIISKSLDQFQFRIVCNDEVSCQIFSIMEVILDWFDVN